MLTGQQCKTTGIHDVFSARLAHTVRMGHRALPAYI